MSTPTVSVIVPTYNSAAVLDACLKSIKAQTWPAVELVVVDNGSSDDTKGIARRYTDLVFDHGPERSAQRNFGAASSHGEYVLFIDSDMQLAEDVVSECVKAIAGGHKALVIPEESIGAGYWAQCKRLERSFYVGVPWMEAARFFDRATFESMGGYDERNTGTEDYDLPQRIAFEHGAGSIGRVTAWIRHDEQQLSLRKTCRKKYYYAQRIHVYTNVPANRANFAKQSSVLARYGLLLSRPRRLLADPVHALGMLFMKTCENASAALGYLVGRARSRPVP